MKTRIPSLLAPLVLAACSTPAVEPVPSRELWEAPGLEDSTVIWRGHDQRIDWSTFLDELARADVVFLGETHLDETTHRVEHAVYEGLIQRRNVVLAMEMFERDSQQHLDDYLGGVLDESDFRHRARPWANYQTAYRPLIETAKKEGLPVVASNFPRSLRMRMMREGTEVLESLEGAERELAPERFLPNTSEYWRRVDNAIRGHRGMMGSTDESPEARLHSTQSLWDNSMGEACALALDRHPGCMVLHVNGGFHSSYWDGTVHQLRQRRPDHRVLTVDLVPSMHPSVAIPDGKQSADYIVYVESRASDVDSGEYSVYTTRKLDYRFRMPDSHEDERVPLLIWLGDDEQRSEDGMNLWQDRLGADCAIAVLDPLHRERLPDLEDGGRWYWSDSFSEDIGAAIAAVERTWAYLMRHYPIDPQRVCLAGEGTGATVVAAVSLLGQRMSARALAFRPVRYSRIKDFPLPLPDYLPENRPSKSLQVLVRPEDEAWWEKELEEYQTVEFPAELRSLELDPWLGDPAQEDTVRDALRLESRARAANADRFHLLANGSRARQWARQRALDEARDRQALVAVLGEPPDETAGSEEISTRIDVTSIRKSGVPRCPGPFGGTTILVLSRSSSLEEFEAWEELEKDDPLQKVSRFHRTRIAHPEHRPLLDVARKLQSENRTNLLVVPATFAADSLTMQDLNETLAPVADQMTLQWQPGLGKPSRP